METLAWFGITIAVMIATAVLAWLEVSRGERRLDQLVKEAEQLRAAGDPVAAYERYKEALAQLLCIGSEPPSRTPRGLCQAMEHQGWDVLAAIQATCLQAGGAGIDAAVLRRLVEEIEALSADRRLVDGYGLPRRRGQAKLARLRAGLQDFLAGLPVI